MSISESNISLITCFAVSLRPSSKQYFAMLYSLSTFAPFHYLVYQCGPLHFSVAKFVPLERRSGVECDIFQYICFQGKHVLALVLSRHV
jgi:hypothetical protein